MSDKEKFKKELKELLKKYNVSIQWDYSSYSDMHGVYEEAIEFVTDFGTPKEKVFNFKVSGQCCSHSNL